MSTKTIFRLPTALRRLFHHPTTKPRVMDDSDGSLLVSHPQTTAPARVAKGHMAVYVGSELRRYVIPVKLLSSPELKELLESAAEEYGYKAEGGLKLPCDENEFDEILMRLRARKSEAEMM